MRVVNVQTGKEHNIDQQTFDLWTKAGLSLKIVEVQKPTSIKEKELLKSEKEIGEVEK